MLASKVLRPPLTPPRDRIFAEQYLLAAGFAAHETSGIYSLLPAGSEVVRQLETLFANALRRRFDSLQIEVPVLQDASLWERSGRLSLFGREMFQLEDAKGRKYVLSPTAEENVVRAMKAWGPMTRASLPLSVFQVGRKYKDEMGGGSISRTREFRMIDWYSFHADEASAQQMGLDLIDEVERLYQFLGIDVITSVSRETVTTEFSGFRSRQLLVRSSVKTGQFHINEQGESVGVLELARWMPLGTIYTERFGLYIADQSRTPVFMTCFGVGAIRCMIALIEKYYHGDQMIWPLMIAPFQVAVTLPHRPQLQERAASLMQVYHSLKGQLRVLLDDRFKGYQQNKAHLELLGVPLLVEVGDTVDTVQIHNRINGHTTCLSSDAAITYISQLMKSSERF